MKEIFLELIKEACAGKVIVDKEEWPYSFNTIIEDREFYENENNKSVLVIKDLDKLIKKIEEYIDVELIIQRKTMKIYNGDEASRTKDKIKWYIVTLFANMTTEDFLNPIEYIDKYIAFLKDKTFDYLNNGIFIDLPKLKNSELEIKNEQNSTSMETPNKISLKLRMKDNHFTSISLPSVYYAIREENNEKVCYIYSVMNKEDKKQTEKEMKFQKQINRLLYKLNDGIEDTEDYYQYKDGKSDYYPEGNISDVTHSFIFSLNIFLSLLQKENIKEVRVVPYLPVRYNSRALAAEEKGDLLEREALRQRNNMIQTNATNKLIRTFRRLEMQNKNLEITSYPYELDEFLRFTLHPRTKELDNMLLEEANEIVNNEIKEK